MEKELIGVREAAKICGKNAETVRRWVWSGALPAQKLGNQLFIEKTALDNFLRKTGTAKNRARRRIVRPEPPQPAPALQGQPTDGVKASTGVTTRKTEIPGVEGLIEFVGGKEQTAPVVEKREDPGALLESVKQVRTRIFARTASLFDAPGDLEKQRGGRTCE